MMETKVSRKEEERALKYFFHIFNNDRHDYETFTTFKPIVDAKLFLYLIICLIYNLLFIM
jgi:hypothetical protein